MGYSPWGHRGSDTIEHACIPIDTRHFKELLIFGIKG